MLNLALFHPEDKILVALSGGADSTALFLLLRDQLPDNLIGAAHFHHGLRGTDADQDAAFCARLCIENNLPCMIGLGFVPKTSRAPDDEGRRQRYDFLIESAEEMGATVIATAHHADDQAETVLLRVLRGTGVEGLAGIPTTRILTPTLRIVRPLLGVRRVPLEQFCEAQNITFRHDPHNDDPTYVRSRLRAQFASLAATYNPRLTEALVRLSENAATDAALLETLARELWETSVTVVEENGYVLLTIPPLLTAHAALRRRVLLRALWTVAGDTPTRAELATQRVVLDLEAAMAIKFTRRDLPGKIRATVRKGVLTLAPSRVVEQGDRGAS
jgi:tRNA(Ile)-lysidine synthase